jgi:hypothetical protein
VAAAPLNAQSEGALREYFGPSTTLGYAKRLKEHGTAIRAGEPALVTKIKVKSKHIEFQLDGGGYGTMGDETSSNVSTQAAPQTRREKNLEAELKRGRITGDFVEGVLIRYSMTSE